MSTAEASVARFSWKPLGGLGEVGMNTMVFDFGGLRIPVDAGILFASPNDFGIESLHPDYRPLFHENPPPVWIITHSHEDHIGAVSGMIQAAVEVGAPVPDIYAPPFAAAILRERLLEDTRCPAARKYIDKILEVPEGGRIKVGHVEVRYLETRHSTPQTFSIAFKWKSPFGQELRIVHTSDFKIDESEFPDGVKTLESIYGTFAPERPHLLFIDSTNAERMGHSVSENALEAGIERVLKEAKGRVFITLFASNVHRIATLAQLAEKTGRYIALAGRSLQTMHRIGKDLGLYGKECPELPSNRFKEPQELSQLHPSKQIIVCSGSQGEHRSVLMKVAFEEHPDFVIGSEDTVLFSSKTIPGNERGISRLVNGLLRRGARVLWEERAKEATGGPVHASGHARGDEIARVMKFLSPDHIVPVHGELRQLLSCAALAPKESRTHIVEDGAVLSFEPGPEGKWDFVERQLPPEPEPKILRFGRFATDSKDPFLTARRRMATGGVVSVAWPVPTGPAAIAIHGMFPENTNPERLEAVREEIESWMYRRMKAYDKRELHGGNTEIQTEVAEDLGRHLRKQYLVRPQVVMHILGG